MAFELFGSALAADPVVSHVLADLVRHGRFMADACDVSSLT
jgi:hypothetical protein